MSKTLFTSLFASLFVGLSTLASAEPYRVGVLPAWKNWAHVHDFDHALKEAGYEFTNMVESAEQFEWLDKHLDEYNLLIAPPLFHYAKTDEKEYKRPYDMAKIAPHLAKWIQEGGCLLVTDANYAEGLSWFKHLDPAMDLTACVDPKDLKTEFKCDGMGPAIAKEPLDSIHFFPCATEYGFSWGHMVIPDESKTAWTVLARCGHGQPTLVIRRWGKGVVLANVLRSYVPQFIENIRVNQQFLELGLKVLESSMPDPLPGTNTFSFLCANDSATPLKGTLALTLTPLKKVVTDNKESWVPAGKGKTYRQSGTVPAGEQGTIALNCLITERGRMRATMTFSTGSLSATCFERDLTLPELFNISSSRHRGMVSKERRFDSISFGTHFYPSTEDPAKYSVCFRLTDAQTNVVAIATNSVALREAWVPVKVSRNLRPGLYTLRGELLLEGKNKPVDTKETSLEIVPAGPGFALFDEDNALLSDGKPFFTLGMYHPGAPKENGGYVGEFGRIADLGFNTINIFSWAGVDKLAKLDKFGVRCFWEQLPHRGIPMIEDQSRTISSSPAGLLNYTMDEPGEAQFDFVRSLNEGWRKYDPYHPTVVVSYQPHHFARNATMSDILAPDPYPWSSKKGDESNVGMVSEWMERARAASNGTRPYFCVPQAFGSEPPHIWRNMALQAIIHGAKGLIWYAWNEGPVGVGLRWHEPLLEEAGRLIPQLRALSPAILNAKDQPRSFWLYENTFHGMVCRDPKSGTWILFLASTDKAPRTFEVELPELPADLTELPGAYGDKALSVSNRIVRAELGSFGSGIYCWGGPAPAVARSYKEFAERPLPARASGRTLSVLAPTTSPLPAGAYTNLQEAVDAAVDGDTLHVGEGSWAPIVTDNKFIEIIATGARSATIIDASNRRRAATLSCKPWGDMTFQTNTVLRGFTLRGGVAENDPVRPELGGGVYGGTLIDCEITSCRAQRGGGAAYTTLSNCTIRSCSATQNGGAAMQSTLNDCFIERTSAAWDGGALDDCVADHCKISACSAGRDGGAAHFGTLNACNIDGNTAKRHGGGAISATSTHTIFRSNTAKEGEGGAVFRGSTDFCTLYENKAQLGGGISSGSLKHSIVNRNKAHQDPDTSAFYNLSKADRTWMDLTSTNNIPRGVRTEDPQFLNPWFGLKLKPSSPCIDAGNDAFIPRSTLDAYGNPRVSGGAPDAGAIETPTGTDILLEADFSSSTEYIGDSNRIHLFHSPRENRATVKDGALHFDGTTHATSHHYLNSYGAELPTWAYFTVECTFRTTSKGGTIFALPTGEEHGIWAEVIDGKLRVVLNYGNPKDNHRAIFETPNRISENAWHTLILRTDRYGGLTSFASTTLDNTPIPCIQTIQANPNNLFSFPSRNLRLGTRKNGPAFHGDIQSIRISASSIQ